MTFPAPEIVAPTATTDFSALNCLRRAKDASSQVCRRRATISAVLCNWTESKQKTTLCWNRHCAAQTCHWWSWLQELIAADIATSWKSRRDEVQNQRESNLNWTLFISFYIYYLSSDFLLVSSRNISQTCSQGTSFRSCHWSAACSNCRTCLQGGLAPKAAAKDTASCGHFRSKGKINKTVTTAWRIIAPLLTHPNRVWDE